MRLKLVCHFDGFFSLLQKRVANSNTKKGYGLILRVENV